MTSKGEERDLAVELHKKFIVFDAHADVALDIALRRTMGESKVFERIHLPQFVAGGVKAACLSVWCDDEHFSFGCLDQPLAVTLRVIGMMWHEFEESPNVIMHAGTVREIRQGVKDGKIAILLHLEGGMPLGTNLDYLKLFYMLGVRSVGLTWSNRNMITDGEGQRSNSGLSNFGVQVVEEMNKLGMIIDVSHLGEKAFFDVLEVSKDPVIASHSNAKSICDTPRNLADEQIKVLAEKGGVMGTCLIPEFVGKEEPSLENALDHVDYVRNLVGVDHIGLGPDFYEYFGPWYLCPAGSNLKGIENASKIHDFTRGLLSREYSEQEIEKILGGNFLRVHERILRS